MVRVAERWLPSPKAAAPLSRLAVRGHDPRWELGALAAHAGICAGNGEQSLSGSAWRTSAITRSCAIASRRFYLKAIHEDLDLTEWMNDAVNSLRILLAADESICTRRAVEL
jgi:hypothetical protein